MFPGGQKDIVRHIYSICVQLVICSFGLELNFFHFILETDVILTVLEFFRKIDRYIYIKYVMKDTLVIMKNLCSLERNFSTGFTLEI